MADPAIDLQLNPDMFDLVELRHRKTFELSETKVSIRTNPTTWVSKCGDGIKAGTEVWDDGNAISGDGWSRDWLNIEDGWICVGSYFGVTDICSQWDQGYGPNPD